MPSARNLKNKYGIHQKQVTKITKKCYELMKNVLNTEIIIHLVVPVKNKKKIFVSSL